MGSYGVEMGVRYYGPDPWEIGDYAITKLEDGELHVRAWRSWAANRQLFTGVNGGRFDVSRGRDFAEPGTFVREDAIHYVATAREYRGQNPSITPEAARAASAAARRLSRSGPTRSDLELLAFIRRFFPEAQIEKIVENGAQVWVGDAPMFGPDAEPITTRVGARK